MAQVASSRRWPDYRTIWRWHFYAGLLCVPLVIWLSITGGIYLFRPQIDSWLDRSYDNLAFNGAARSPAEQVAAALTAVPGGNLNAYELPRSSHSAVQILVGHGTELTRVYVHPQSLAILKTLPDGDRPMELINHLHGELLQGDKGSMVVETAASWAIVMLITGLYLWWPRGATGAAGVLFPRLRAGQRVFWRDVHAVTALWVSFFALFLLISGLPWTSSWGGMLTSLRALATPVEQPWTTGTTSELKAREAANTPATDPHAQHHMHMDHAMPPPEAGGLVLDRLVPIAIGLHLAPPVLIAPPSVAAAHWTVRSDAQNRPLRVTLDLDAGSGAIVGRNGFAEQPLLDRVIGVTTAAHEGQLFPPVNQLLGLFTACGLLTVSISAIVMWWRRRPDGVLGAPSPRKDGPFAAGLFVVIAVIGVLLPLFGTTLLLVLLAERLILRRHEPTRKFLGLAGQQGLRGT